MTRASISARQRIAIFEAANGVCHICCGKIHVGDKWDVEHVSPLSMGGEDGGDNLKPAHKSCHAGKTAAEAPIRAKVMRVRAKHLGIRKPSKFSASRDGQWKQKIGGGVVRRQKVED